METAIHFFCKNGKVIFLEIENDPLILPFFVSNSKYWVFFNSKPNFIFGYNCMLCYAKSVQIRSFSWPVFSCIQSKYREIRTRKNSLFGHFSRSDTTIILTVCYYYVTPFQSYSIFYGCLNVKERLVRNRLFISGYQSKKSIS